MHKTSLLMYALLFAAHTLGGELRLSNGALIPGELVRIEADKLVWNATLIGEIKVDKKSVLSMDSTTRSTLQIADKSVLQECRISSSGSEAQLECANGRQTQTTLAELEPAKPEREASGKLSVSMTKESGNSPKDEFEGDATSTWRVRKRQHTLSASFDYEEKDGDTSDDEASLDYQIDLLRERGWFWFAAPSYRRDRFDTIQESEAVTFGIGRDMKPREGLKLRLQGGLAPVRLDIEDVGREEKMAGQFKWSGTWDTGLWKMELFHEGDYIWVLDDADIYRLQSKTGLTLPLIERLVAELKLEYTRTGFNQSGLKDNEMEWVLALGYRW